MYSIPDIRTVAFASIRNPGQNLRIQLTLILYGFKYLDQYGTTLISLPVPFHRVHRGLLGFQGLGHVVRQVHPWQRQEQLGKLGGMCCSLISIQEICSMSLDEAHHGRHSKS